MTRVEAIEILEDLDGYFSDNQGRDYDKAFRMAIEALQRQTDGDLISRADAIEAVRSRLYQSAMNNDGEARETFADIAENRIEVWINEVPSAETHEIRTETHGVCSNLISREKAIESMELESAKEGAYGYIDIKSAVEMLESLPSADAVRGEWHKTENEEMEITGYYCSVCDMPTDEPTNYCGNCGARMKAR